MAEQVKKLNVLQAARAALFAGDDMVFMPVLAVQDPVAAHGADVFLALGDLLLERGQGKVSLADFPLLPVVVQYRIVPASKPLNQNMPLDGCPGVLPHERLLALEGPVVLPVFHHRAPISLLLPRRRLAAMLTVHPLPLPVEQVVIQFGERARRSSHTEVVGP